jgi:predicted metal-dependent hydrolase
VTAITHGLSAYANGQCRCQVCRTAGVAWTREWRRLSRFTGPRPGVKHGLASTYRNYNCRCEPCRTANTAAKRAWRARNRAARQALQQGP